MTSRLATRRMSVMAFAVAGTAVLAAGPAAFGQSASPGGQQVVQTALPGEVCTYDKYNGGVPQITDLTAATIGFAQSEKEANPFRIAETQSIKDEAAEARHHQPARHQRPVRPEQGDLGHQGHDRPGRAGADHLAPQLRRPRSCAGLRQGEEGPDHDHRPVPDHQDGVLGLHRLGRLGLRGAGAPRGRGDDPRDR